MMKKRTIAGFMAAAMVMGLTACGSSADTQETTAAQGAETGESAAEGEAEAEASGQSGLEDGVLSVAMECSYAPYNWTQQDDSNGAVQIKGSSDYAYGYDVMMAKHIAEELGAHPVPVVDSAFLETPDAVIPEAVQSQLGGQYVVFVPNALTWHYRYRNVPQERIDRFHLDVMELLSEKYPGHTIVMLPQTYRSVINDYGYFRRLAERAAGKPVLVIDEDQSSDVQQKIIAGARVAVGERYHSVVFAINNRTPFVSLSYEHKMTGLLEKLGLTERSVDVQGIFADESGELCRRALEQVHSLLEQDVFVPPQLDPRAFVREGFEKLCRSIEELVQGKAG